MSSLLSIYSRTNESKEWSEQSAGRLDESMDWLEGGETVPTGISFCGGLQGDRKVHEEVKARPLLYLVHRGRVIGIGTGVGLVFEPEPYRRGRNYVGAVVLYL